SSGLSKLQRRDLAEVVLEYCRPCAHLDSTLEGLCSDLEQIQWSEVAALASLGREAPPPSWLPNREEKPPKVQEPQEPLSRQTEIRQQTCSDTGGSPTANVPRVDGERKETAAERPAVPSLPLARAQADPAEVVQQRLQEILQRGQQERLDLRSLQEPGARLFV
ncbi:unnamed protein product, partial [Effrenium voratum]